MSSRLGVPGERPLSLGPDGDQCGGRPGDQVGGSLSGLPLSLADRLKEW